MEISKRLKAVADLVTYQTVADIGTDHGYVPLYLYEQNRITKAFASDINKGSLQKAIENIAMHHAGEVIETRLGDGLHTMQPNEAETLVLTGIGGMLMIRILDECPAVVQSAKELVLSPQRHMDEVRRYLHKINFTIAEESLMRDGEKEYVLIRAVPGAEKYDREIDYLFGKQLLLEKNAVLKERLEIEYRKTERILKELQAGENTEKRLQEIKEKQEQLKEGLACLQE